MSEDLVGKRQNKNNWFHVGMLALWRQAMKIFGAIGSNQPIGASAFVRFLWQMDASSELGNA